MRSTNSADINQIVLLAQGGDKSAEEKLFQYLRVRFTFLAKRRIGGEDAEDIAHDACMTVQKKYKTYEHHSQFEAWAYQILRNNIGNYLQHKKIEEARITRPDYENNVPDTLSKDSDPTMLQTLISCLRKLIKVNRLYARALNLTHQGYSTGEICHRLKIKPNHFYVALNRGRKALSDCMSKGGYDEK